MFPFEISLIAAPTAYLFQLILALQKCYVIFSCKLRVMEYMNHFNSITDNPNLIIHVNTSQNTYQTQISLRSEYITSRFILSYVRN